MAGAADARAASDATLARSRETEFSMLRALATLVPEEAIINVRGVLVYKFNALSPGAAELAATIRASDLSESGDHPGGGR